MKRSNPQEKPIISWCLIARNAEKTIETTLKSLRALTPDAEIVVVDTMSSDSTPEIAKRYADVWAEYKGPRGDWTREMFAFDDASAARNKSFELANGHWIGWVDADDELASHQEVHQFLSINGYLVPGNEKLGELGEQKGEVDIGSGQKAPARDFESFLEASLETDVEGFYAPYLYRFKDGEEGKKGKAEEWQVRERIVRVRDGLCSWSWHRKAHEVLVPEDKALHGKMQLLSALLFVHRKEWNEADRQYTVDRHYKIIRADYDAGKRDFFDLYYLVTYAPQKCPAERSHLLDEYLAAASTGGERARAHYKRGLYLMGEGYYFEALEAFTAGTVTDSSLADNYFGLAITYSRGGRWLRAAQAYEAGCAQSYIHPFAVATPREHGIVNRIQAGLCYWRAWREGQANEAVLGKAAQIAEAALAEPGALSADAIELKSWVRLLKNEAKGEQVLRNLKDAADYLIANDETTKASKVAELVPHNMEDRTTAIELQNFARKLERHRDDPESYQQFYSQFGTDKANTDEQIKYADKLPRVQMVKTYLKLQRENLGRPLKILEIGTWDGITFAHLMEALPDSQFTAIEANAAALERLKGRVEAKDWNARFRGVQGILSHDTMLKAKGGDGSFRFDAIVFCEVIEHIVDPTKAFEEIRWALADNGRLFVSTPWGAFDRGQPEDLKERDPRGHVHAYTPRALYELLAGNGFKVLEANGQWSPHFEGNFGDTQVLMAEAGKPGYALSIDGKEVYRPPASPTFVVPSALWDWNASLVEETGMGASEETIVYLARGLGRKGGAPQVYGPLPKDGSLDLCEVRDSVAYWPLSQLHRMGSSSPIIVSRAPSVGGQLKQMLRNEGKPEPKRLFLWLQDTYYADLNVKTAADYERIVVLSQWHREQIVAASGIPLEKFKIVPNFLLKEHFPDVPSKLGAKREPHRFIYCSSPDRGLLPLLRMWPEILRRWPDATLGIYYGWEGAIRLASTNPDWTREYKNLRGEYNKLRYQPGVQEFGRVNHAIIAHEMRRASVWAYPTVGRSSVETFCSNAVKARAAGCVPVTLPEAALKETAKSSLTQFVEWSNDFDRDFIDAIGRAFEATEAQRDEMAAEAISQYELSRVMPLWEELLK